MGDHGPRGVSYLGDIDIEGVILALWGPKIRFLSLWGPKNTLFWQRGPRNTLSRAQNYPPTLVCFFLVFFSWDLGQGPKITPITKIYTPGLTVM